MPRSLKLTTVGLSIREELRVKSLLKVTNTKTHDQWLYSEDTDSHVALCDALSALASVMQRRSDRAGGPRCVTVVPEGVRATPGHLTLRAPVRLSELIELLNSVSVSMGGVHSRSEDGLGIKADDEVTRRDGPFSFALSLRDHTSKASRDMYRVDAGDVSLLLLPAMRTLLVKEPMSDELLRKLLVPTLETKFTPLSDSQAQLLLAEGTKTCTVDWLLWRLGLGGTRSHLLPELPADGKFALRRWPDFGRLEHRSFHLRMAALLTRGELDAMELANASSQPAHTARAFINACALCNLITSRTSEAMPVARAPAAVLATPRDAAYSGLFRTIRKALGFGAV